MAMMGYVFTVSVVLSVVTVGASLLILLAVPHTHGIRKSTWFDRTFSEFQRKLPVKYQVRRSNPIFRIQISQVLTAAAMAVLGCFIGSVNAFQKTPEINDEAELRCDIFVVLFGVAFGLNQFFGYCFLLIKALTVDATWRTSTLKELMRTSTAYLTLLAFIIPRSATGILNSEGNCVIHAKPTVIWVLVTVGCVMDILLKIGYNVLFAEPLMEIAKTQSNLGKDGKTRASKARELIRKNFRSAFISWFFVILGLMLAAYSLTYHDAQLPFIGMFIVMLSHTIPSLTSTKKAWARNELSFPRHSIGSNPPTGEVPDRSSAKKNSRPPRPSNTKTQEMSSRDDQDVNSKSDNTSETEDLKEASSVPASPSPQAASGASTHPLEEVKEAMIEESKGSEKKPVTHTHSNNKKGSHTGSNENHDATTTAVGRGAYAGIAMNYTIQEIDVEIKFDATAGDALFDVTSLEQAMPEAPKRFGSLDTGPQAAVSRGAGLNIVRDTYMDPIFLQSGGVARGAGAIAPRKPLPVLHASKGGVDTEVSSTHSIPKAGGGVGGGSKHEEKKEEGAADLEQQHQKPRKSLNAGRALGMPPVQGFEIMPRVSAHATVVDSVISKMAAEV